ncbi:D-inositol-3-phosphate glycosyltransferase [bioreactor metagenome]|uniref:D-inositol-3-phosphate glycosyltransferase n=1 Tax=bioreactor metagenome TaxID=1076179 RepID=A0A645I0T3_9ZZZZ
MLEALAARLVPGQVRFLGHRADVPQRMARAAMVLASCKVEGLGLSVVEAMALGVPVVAAAAGGHLETVGGVADAALFAPDDEHEAGGLLRELAADPQRRADYGARLREYQRAEFALPEQASRTEKVYRSLL